MRPHGNRAGEHGKNVAWVVVCCFFGTLTQRAPFVARPVVRRSPVLEQSTVTAGTDAYSCGGATCVTHFGRATVARSTFEGNHLDTIFSGSAPPHAQAHSTGTLCT